MRFFVVSDPTESAVAVVFHDHRDHAVYCRSLKASFLSAFDASCSKKRVMFSKEDSGASVLRILDRGASDYNWISDILSDLCSDYWNIAEHGEIVHSEHQVDLLADRYLS